MPIKGQNNAKYLTQFLIVIKNVLRKTKNIVSLKFQAKSPDEYMMGFILSQVAQIS